MFNHRQLCTDPAFMKDFTQSVEEAGFESVSDPSESLGSPI